MEDKKEDPRGMYRIIDSLLNRRKALPLPEHESAAALAEEFAEYFTGKIDKIRCELRDAQSGVNVEWEICKYHTVMNTFHEVSEDDVRKIITSSRTTSCELDPVPTDLLKLCLNEILPLITAIVNLSFTSSSMPSSL